MDPEKRYSIDKHLGRLVINEDRSRYVSNQFWASMGDEIAEMRDLLDAPSSDEEDPLDEGVYNSTNSPSTDRYASHQGFIFGFSSLKVDLKSLHPSPSQIFILWEVYKENVDPVVKLIHRPTTRNILLNAASSTDKITRPAEALLFSIYYGAVTSLTQDQCRKLLDEDRIDLIKKYRFATEQALARADFLNSSSLMCLQAFVAFLVFVRNMDDSRLVWALGGLAIHIAQALGIHRDGSHFGLPPFDIEMRRRLWWHISILDNRSSEDHGTDPTFSEQFYDTKLPLNVNDEDIWPGMLEPPTPRVGATEMTFCLIRFELSVFNRRLNITSPGIGPNAMVTHPSSGNCTLRDQTLTEKETMIDTCHTHIESQYLTHCDMSSPILWVSATVARLILAKMWLMVHHPRSYFNDGDAPPPQEVKDRLFVTSIEVIEFSYLLERNENTAKWGWLFRSYMQWQSVAFVLSEICARSGQQGAAGQWTQEIERGWRAVESVYNVRFIQPDVNHRGMLWRPMRTLWRKAREARNKALAQCGAAPPQQQGKGQQAKGDLTSGGRWDATNTNTNASQPLQTTDSPTEVNFGATAGNSEVDPWVGNWITDNNNIVGASGAAFGLDLGEMLTPGSASSGGGMNTNPSTNSNQQPQTGIGGASRGVVQQGAFTSQNQNQASAKTSAPILAGTAASAGNMHSNNTSPDLDTNMDSQLDFTGLPNGNFTNQDFFNWSGWNNPGVGDFTVGPMGAMGMGMGMPMMNGMGMGMNGMGMDFDMGQMGMEGDGQQEQQGAVGGGGGQRPGQAQDSGGYARGFAGQAEEWF